MSWFIESKGTKDAVRADVDKQFAKQLESYPETTEEGKDIVAARDRLLAMLDAVVIEDFANAIEVKASGSRCSSAAGFMSGSSSIQLTRIHLAL